MKYEDYVHKRDGGVGQALDAEIADAQVVTPAPRNDGFAMPDKFANKSPEEIAQSYVELEQTYSRQGNDLGQMRRTVDQLIALQSQPNTEPVHQEPVTADELWEDPEQAVRRAVSPQLSELENEMAQLKQVLVEQQLTNQYPDWQKTTSDPQFQTWVQERPYRRRLAIAAGQSDTDAASELLDLYSDSTGASQAQAQNQRQTDLANASLERGGGTPTTPDASGGDIYSRHELMNKRIASKNGDGTAEHWLKSNSAAIQLAYQEGRIVD